MKYISILFMFLLFACDGGGTDIPNMANSDTIDTSVNDSSGEVVSNGVIIDSVVYVNDVSREGLEVFWQELSGVIEYYVYYASDDTLKLQSDYVVVDYVENSYFIDYSKLSGTVFTVGVTALIGGIETKLDNAVTVEKN